MIRVPLTQGHFALVDDIDAPLVLRYSWQILQSHGVSNHARTHLWVRPGRRVTALMHRLILSDPCDGGPAGSVDHINGDGLDNRRSNLRVSTHQQNCANQRAVTKTSRYKGVSWARGKSRWAVAIREDGEQQHLGYFSSEDAAAREYDAAARRVYGSFAALNFPKPGEQTAHRPRLAVSHA